MPSETSGTIVVGKPAAVGPASSPKLAKAKPIIPQPTLQVNTPKNKALGCEHLLSLIKKPTWSQDELKDKYGKKLDAIIDWRTEQRSCITCNGNPISLYLCLECTELNCFDDAEAHMKGEEHGFVINIRNGYLWCQACRDFVYDAELERVRTAHDKVIASTSFRKRKRPAADEARYIENNSQPQPCKATGIRGIVNFGSSCYVSVVLHSLLQNPIMRNHFLTRPHGDNDCSIRDCMVCAMGQVFDTFYTEDAATAFAPVQYIRTTWKRRDGAFAKEEQRDAQEYWNWVIDNLHECYQMGQDDRTCSCIVHQTFNTTIQHNRQCKKCRTKKPASHSLEMGLSVALDQDDHDGKKKEVNGNKPVPSLKSCLDTYMKEKTPTDVMCDGCGVTTVFDTINSIKKFPLVWAITFKTYSNKGEKCKKNGEKVHFPLSIDMKEWSTSVKIGRTKLDDAPSFWYDLYCVVVHDGEKLNEGHYICYSRDRDGQWYSYNDAFVHTITEEKLLKVSPYMLFYVVRKIPEIETSS